MKTRGIAGIVCLMAGLILSANTHAAIYTCVDKDGKKTFQELPCPVAPGTAVASGKSDYLPVLADAPSMENALETIHRFDLASSARNPEASMRFIADSFRAELHRPAKKVVTYDAKAFAVMLHEVLPAVEKYHVEHYSCTQGATTGKQELVLVCRVTERGKIPGKKENLVKSTETIRIISRGGKILIDGIVANAESMEDLN
ncbi:MAG: DUF4124 domain-containing protein [Betaproteobacteria bacterium]|nr:DUF4124 domain-containing protein [Betaproteobacteria bacterium]